MPSESFLIRVPLICCPQKQLCSQLYPIYRVAWECPAVSASSGLVFMAKMAVKPVCIAQQHKQTLGDSPCLKA